MRNLKSLLIIVSLLFGVPGCERASTPLSPTDGAAIAAPGQTSAKASAVVFAKIPAQYAETQIAAGTDVQAFLFSVDTTTTKG